MTSDIGEYYERKRKEQEAAGEALKAAKIVYEKHPCYETYEAMMKAEEKWLDAGNTGD